MRGLFYFNILLGFCLHLCFTGTVTSEYAENEEVSVSSGMVDVDNLKFILMQTNYKFNKTANKINPINLEKHLQESREFSLSELQGYLERNGILQQLTNMTGKNNKGFGECRNSTNETIKRHRKLLNKPKCEEQYRSTANSVYVQTGLYIANGIYIVNELSNIVLDCCTSDRTQFDKCVHRKLPEWEPSVQMFQKDFDVSNEFPNGIYTINELSNILLDCCTSDRTQFDKCVHQKLPEWEPSVQMFQKDFDVFNEKNRAANRTFNECNSKLLTDAINEIATTSACILQFA